MHYYPWTEDDDDDSLAWIEEDPENIRKKIYLLNEGISVKDWFPKATVFDLTPDEGIKLADAIPNISMLLFISDKLKGILEQKANANFEFLPIKIRDKKGHIVKRDYFIANLLDTVECVDMTKSDLIMDSIIKNQVYYFKKLVLDEDKLDPDRKIFRLKEKTNLIITRKDLALDILDAGCTGISFREIDDYGSEYRD